MQGIEQVFLSQGILGAIVIVLSAVIVFQYKENKSLQTDYRTSQDNRLQDAKDFGEKTTELAEKVITTTGQLNELFRTNNRGT